MAFTVKHPVHVPLEPPLLLSTTTLRAPIAALAAIVMFAVSDVADTNVVEFTVIRVPENDTVAPLTKFVPVTTMS